MMQTKLFRFFFDESGAVTVDWVVLTGAIVGLGILVMVPIGYSTSNSANSVGTFIATQPVGYQSTP
jgi:Flp pilus assembly pilin Flp